MRWQDKGWDLNVQCTVLRDRVALSVMHTPSTDERTQPRSEGDLAVVAGRNWSTNLQAVAPRTVKTKDNEKSNGEKVGLFALVDSESLGPLYLLIDSGATGHVCGPFHFAESKVNLSKMVVLSTAGSKALTRA